MALIYKPTKLKQQTVDAIEKAVKKGKHTSFNAAVNAGLENFFKVKVT